jgi:hypothetical protein
MEQTCERVIDLVKEIWNNIEKAGMQDAQFAINFLDELNKLSVIH